MSLSRRDLLAGAAGSLALAPFAGGAAPEAPRAGRFRLVHMTDFHVRGRQGAREGIALAVRQVLRLKPRPDMVIVGGDVGDGLMGAGADAAAQQFAWLKELMKPLEMPVHYVVGNHDIFGWGTAGSRDSRDPVDGKKRFLDEFVKGPSYRALEHKGSRILLLDTIQPSKDGEGLPYVSRVDDDQMQWIGDQLEAAKESPVIAVLHSPMLSGYFVYNDGPYAKPAFPSLLENGKELHELLRRADVPLVLQGHTHVAEALDYAGRRHITSGAVCGSWWAGKRLGVDPEGFSIIDFDPSAKALADRVKWTYQATGWVVRE